MRVLFLTEWFDPIPTHKGLSFVAALRDQGHEIEVATTFPPHGRQTFHEREVMDGITVHRLPHYRSHDASSLRRSVTFGSFFASALAFGLAHGRRFDVIYAYHPPITVGLAAVLAGARWRRPVVLDVLDLWPDVLGPTGMVGARAQRALARLCAYVYGRAAAISVPTQAFRRRLIETGVAGDKIALIYDCADETKARPSGTTDLSPYRLNGRFNVVYGGNFGKLQQLDVVIEAARLAHRSNPAIQLTLVGGGSDEDRVRRLSSENPDAVRVHGSIPMAQIGDVFDAADVLLVSLAKDEVLRKYIPSKLSFYLAMGKPVLAAIAGEGAEVLANSGAGLAVEPGDPQALAAAMLRMAAMDGPTLAGLGRDGRRFYERTMSFDLAVTGLSDLIKRVG